MFHCSIWYIGKVFISRRKELGYGVSKKLTKAVSETKMRIASKKLPQVVSDLGLRDLKKLNHKKPA